MNTKLDWNVINDYNERSLLRINKHSKFDIFILNYNQKCKKKKFSTKEGAEIR